MTEKSDAMAEVVEVEISDDSAECFKTFLKVIDRGLEEEPEDYIPNRLSLMAEAIRQCLLCDDVFTAREALLDRTKFSELFLRGMDTLYLKQMVATMPCKAKWSMRVFTPYKVCSTFEKDCKKFFTKVPMPGNMLVSIPFINDMDDWCIWFDNGAQKLFMRLLEVRGEDVETVCGDSGLKTWAAVLTLEGWPDQQSSMEGFCDEIVFSNCADLIQLFVLGSEEPVAYYGVPEFWGDPFCKLGESPKPLDLGDEGEESEIGLHWVDGWDEAKFRDVAIKAYEEGCP